MPKLAKIGQISRFLRKKGRRLEKDYTTVGGGGGDKYELCLLAFPLFPS